MSHQKVHSGTLPPPVSSAAWTPAIANAVQNHANHTLDAVDTTGGIGIPVEKLTITQQQGDWIDSQGFDLTTIIAGNVYSNEDRFAFGDPSTNMAASINANGLTDMKEPSNGFGFVDASGFTNGNDFTNVNELAYASDFLATSGLDQLTYINEFAPTEVGYRSDDIDGSM
jgi:hypothetical protein